jgi:hypothetical protein
MIVHRQLCDGILKGWSRDPAHRSYNWGTFERLLYSSPKGKTAFPSSLH